MQSHSSILRPLAVFIFAVALTAGVTPARSQESGKGFELHANGNVTAADVGLPVYPGSRLTKEKGDNSSVDMGFSFGDTHFRLVAARYVSGDSVARIFDFYRKSLGRYGDVLECDHGKPVGSVKTARSGLTCGSSSGGEVSSDGHELRAGTPQKFRIVGIDEQQGSDVQFGLVYLEVPKDSDSSK